MIKLATVPRKRRWAVLTALAAAVLLPVTTATAAAAAPAPQTVNAPQAVKLGNYEVAYAKSWTFKAEDIGVCATFRVTGDITYSVSYRPNDKLHLRYMWTSQKLHDPTLITTIHAYNHGACNKPARAVKVKMSQAYSGYSCSFNPSLSFGLPWSVGVSGWPSCGNRDLARFLDVYTGDKTTYKQFDSGIRTGFGEYDSVPPLEHAPTPPCYGVYVTGTVYEGSGSTSDSYGGSPAKVCLSKY